MFINLSNHPSRYWSTLQITEALKYGEILDIPFPQVDPAADEVYIRKLAAKILREIELQHPVAVMCQGEMNLSFEVIKLLLDKGITVVAACSRREVTEEVSTGGETVKTARFEFTCFRKF